MKTLILCDKPSAHFQEVDIGAEITAALRDTPTTIELIRLDGDDIHPCLGCFHCWVKTPGVCRQTLDSANTVARQEVQADALVIVSKITYGGYSYDTKAFLDRSIQNISPFFKIIKGEMRHKMRYTRFPTLITIGYGEHTKREEEIFTHLASRNALNFRPPDNFVFTAANPEELHRTVERLRGVLSSQAHHE